MAAAIEIPINGDLIAQAFRFTLSSRRYRFVVRWNARAEFWTLSLFDENDDAIISEAKVVPGWAPLRQYKRATMPPGEIAVYDTDGVNDRIGRDDFGFGRRFRLLYVTEV